jgi:hypothetical protein
MRNSGLALHDAPLVMARFGPRVGKQDEHARQTVCRQDVQERPCVALENADVVEPVHVDLPQERGDAIHEVLGAEDPDVRVARRLPRQVLAAAKSDLQPQGSRRPREQRSRIEGLPRRRQVNAQFWQQLLQQAAATGPQRSAVTPAMQISPGRASRPVRSLGGVVFAGHGRPLGRIRR